MNAIRVNKRTLLETLKRNRAEHRKIFLEAVEGYKKEATKQLEDHLARIKSGKYYQVYVVVAQPMDQTKDYDRTIGMLEMSLDTEIELSEQDYKSYVLDDWTWKTQFLSSNRSYSATASATMDAMSLNE